MYKVGHAIFSVSGVRNQNRQMLLALNAFKISEGIPDVEYHIIYLESFENLYLKDIIYFNENFLLLDGLINTAYLTFTIIRFMQQQKRREINIIFI